MKYMVFNKFFSLRLNVLKRKIKIQYNQSNKVNQFRLNSIVCNWVRPKGKSRKFINETINSHRFNQHRISYPPKNQLIYPEASENGQWLRPVDCPQVQVKWWGKQTQKNTIEWKPMKLGPVEFPIFDD